MMVLGEQPILRAAAWTDTPSFFIRAHAFATNVGVITVFLGMVLPLFKCFELLDEFGTAILRDVQRAPSAIRAWCIEERLDEFLNLDGAADFLGFGASSFAKIRVCDWLGFLGFA